MTAKAGARSRWRVVLAKWLATAPREKRDHARIDRLSGHLLRDIGLIREKEALRHWQDIS